MIAELDRISAPAVRLPAQGAAPAGRGGGAGRRRRLRQARWLLFGAALAALVGWALWPVPLLVETAPIGRGPLRVTVDEQGITRVQQRYLVAAPVAGRLLRVALEQGDAVAPGQVVARIAAGALDLRSAEQARARVDAAGAAVAGAAAALGERRTAREQAQREARRARVLAEAGALSEAAREQAETALVLREQALAAAGANLAAARAELSAARAALRGADANALVAATTTPVLAPVGGRVLRVLQQSETSVAPGTPLLELGDANALEVLVDVLSADAVRIEPGMPLLVEEWGGAGVLPGRVRTVSPTAFTHVSALGVEEQRVNVVGDLLTPSRRLGEGYRVEARIVTWQSPGVLQVPGSALFRHGSGWRVFVVQGGRARLREVTIGHRGESAAEVLHGLRAGEQVILYPSDRVAEGVRVRGS